MHPAPTFAMLARGDLRLVLSAPGRRRGRRPGDARRHAARARAAGTASRSRSTTSTPPSIALRERGRALPQRPITGVGGRQVLVEDPSGNPVELFQPTRAEARLG